MAFAVIIVAVVGVVVVVVVGDAVVGVPCRGLSALGLARGYIPNQAHPRHTLKPSRKLDMVVLLTNTVIPANGTASCVPPAVASPLTLTRCLLALPLPFPSSDLHCLPLPISCLCLLLPHARRLPPFPRRPALTALFNPLQVVTSEGQLSHPPCLYHFTLPTLG